MRARLGRLARISALALSACVLVAASAHAQATPATTPPQVRFGAFGYLPVEVRQVRRRNCWKLTVRGEVQNPYGEPVNSVRLIVRLRMAGEKPRVLERIETELDGTIDAGESLRFDRTLTTACTSVFNDISLVAFAGHRGKADLPVPERDVEVAAGQAQQAFSGPTNIPLPYSIVVP